MCFDFVCVCVCAVGTAHQIHVDCNCCLHPPHTHALANVQGTARYSTVQQRTARYSKVQHRTSPHTTAHHHMSESCWQHIQLSCVELMTIMSHSPGPEWLIKVLSLSVVPTASRERTPRYNTRNISAHHGTARHSTCSVAVIGMEYAGLVDVTVEGSYSASSCACK